MPTDLVLLVVTSLFAVTALAAAVVTVRAARRTTETAKLRDAPAPPAPTDRPPRTAVLVPLDDAARREPAPRRVEGRVVVPPTGQQVVNAAMSRPHVRLAVLAHGLTYALRPESRDRITALMRREFRRRRRERLAAGRRAVRAAHPTTPDAWTEESWIGELPTGSQTSSKVDS